MGRPLNSLVSVFDGDVTEEKGIGFTGFLKGGKADPPPESHQRPLTGQRASGTPKLSGPFTLSSPRAGLRHGVSQTGAVLDGAQAPRAVPTPGERTLLPPTIGMTSARPRAPRAPQSILAQPEAMSGLVPESALREQLLLAMLGGQF